MIRVLVDADNVDAVRVALVLAQLPAAAVVTAAGHPEALAAVGWPDGAELLPAVGWQRADLALAAAYRAAEEPLLLVTGDSDFALLAARHPGPVLVVSEAPSGRLRDAVPVFDPAVDDPGVLRRWLDAVVHG